MSIIAIITARGGSKRIPKKNITEFMGKPMIAYAIEAAINSGVFDEVMVSTDNDEIASVAIKYGARVPFMRSDKTANDNATTFDALEEVVLEYQKRGKNFDNLCCIYPCVPFLKAETLKNAYEIFKKYKMDALIPVVKYSFPIQRAFRVNGQGYLEYREAENAMKRSQDLEVMYHDSGMFYFENTNKMLENKTLVGKNTKYIEMDERQIQDIDTVEDWQMAEMKYRILKEWIK